MSTMILYRGRKIHVTAAGAHWRGLHASVEDARRAIDQADGR